MRLWGPISLIFAVGVAAACGGSLDVDPGASGGAAGMGTGGTTATGGTGGSGGDAGPDARDSGKDARQDSSDGDGYVDPMCPDVMPPPPMEECDPFATNTGCPVGEACYPFNDYPNPNDPCAFELFGTVCLAPGFGKQGDPCDGQACAANHVCVKTGVGTQCAQLCPRQGADNCPPGLLCQPLDVDEKYGVCF